MGDGYLKISKSRHLSYKFRKKIRVDRYVPNDLKWSDSRKKTRFYGTLITSDLIDFRPGMGRYRYDRASLTFSSSSNFHRSPLQFGTFIDVPIVYRRLKTLLEYLYCILRYGKPNMAKCYDASPHPKISNPHISEKNFQIFLKFCPALGDHVYLRLNV